MKIKISKTQWELLKTSQLEQLSPEDMKFLKRLPPHVLQGILEEIKIKSPSDKEVQQLIENLKRMERKVMDRMPAPSLEQISQVIEQIKINEPNNPALKYFEDLQHHTMETNRMVSEEDKFGTQKAIDNLLDMFSQGKITKQQLQQSLVEFAKAHKNVKFAISKLKNNSMPKQAQDRMNRNQEELNIEKQQAIQKLEKHEEFRHFMDALDEDNPSKMQPLIKLVTTIDGTLIGDQKFDQDKLDEIFGKHEFNRFCVKDIARKLWRGTEMWGGGVKNKGYFLLIDGMGVNKYLSKYNTQTTSKSECHTWLTKAAQESENQVAKIILEQLGGNKFIAMTGAKNFINLGNGLSFKLPGAGFTKNGINFVKIILDPSDTYNIEFGRTRGTTYKVINTTNDIYFDVLQEVFTRYTGLETHL